MYKLTYSVFQAWKSLPVDIAFVRCPRFHSAAQLAVLPRIHCWSSPAHLSPNKKNFSTLEILLACFEKLGLDNNYHQNVQCMMKYCLNWLSPKCWVKHCFDSPQKINNLSRPAFCRHLHSALRSRTRFKLGSATTVATATGSYIAPRTAARRCSSCWSRGSTCVPPLSWSIWSGKVSCFFPVLKVYLTRPQTTCAHLLLKFANYSIHTRIMQIVLHHKQCPSQTCREKTRKHRRNT